MIWKDGERWRWNDKFVNWLREQAENGLVVNKIVEITNVDYKRLQLIAKENNIEFKIHPNDSGQNQIYHDYDWCYYMYMNKGMNHEEMAKEAGCTKRVIEKWCCERHRLTQEFRMKNKKLSEKQSDLMIGSVLGDGHIDKRETQPLFILSHAENQKEYLYWKYEIMKDFCNIEPVVYKGSKQEFNGKMYNCQNSYRMATRIQNCFIKYREMSIIELLKELNEFSFSIWILDDGHRSRSNWSLCVARFSEEEKNCAIEIINKAFGLSAYIQNSDKRYLNFTSNDSRKLDEIIKRNIPNNLDIVKYKILEKDITKPVNKYFYNGMKLSDYCRKNNLKYTYGAQLLNKGYNMDCVIKKMEEKRDE